MVLVAFAVGVSAWAGDLLEDEARAQFDRDLADVRGAIERETLLYVEALRGARGFVAQSEQVTHAEWHGYVAMLDVEQRYRALRALSLNAYVHGDEKAAYEAVMRGDPALRGAGDSPFSIRPPGNRSHYVVVQYIAPIPGNEAAIGFDIASEPLRADAVERAWRIGDATATQPVPLVQVNGTATGILILLPVYSYQAPLATLDQRIAALEFFVVAVVDPEALAAHALAAIDRPLQVLLTDDGPADSGDSRTLLGGSRLLYASGPSPAELDSSAKRQAVVQQIVAGRIWTLRVDLPAAYSQGVSGWAPALILIMGLPLSGLAGAFTYVQLTRRARAVEEADRLTSKLRESEERRTLLMNNVAHELNGVLTPLQLQVYLLRSPKDRGEEATRQSLAILERNVENLKRLVEDLHDVARLEAGRLRLQRAEFDVANVVRQVGAESGAVAKDKQVELVVETLEGVRVSADPQRIAQVLRNLLSNALKFTPSGGKVHVRMESHTNAVDVLVIDTGRGLSPEEINQLFRPFIQVHDPSEKIPKGTGLGLYISKGLIEASGGTMGCQSSGLGSGATFWFRLPKLGGSPEN